MHDWRAVFVGGLVWLIPCTLLIQLGIWASGISQTAEPAFNKRNAMIIDLTQINDFDFMRSEQEAVLSPAVLKTSVWVLQVGAFVNESLADALQNKLISEGYPVYQTIKKRGSKSLILLRLGPFSNHQNIKAIQTEIHQKLQINGIIYRVKYEEGS